MTDERGERVDEAAPSTPVQVIGLSGVPDAGDAVHAVENERVAKRHRRAPRSRRAARARPRRRRAARSRLEELFARSAEATARRSSRVVVKADVHGSAEALREALLQLLDRQGQART